jgi:Ran GTPase-activating protein (RanGAP) involved in mRNA processing and transport
MHDPTTSRIEAILSNLDDATITAEQATQEMIAVLADPRCKLTALALWRNNIGLAGAQALAQALKDPNCTLKHLNLWKNNIGDAGAQAIAEALKDSHCKLTELNLGDSNIGTVGKQALFDAALACAQKGRLIQIHGAYSKEQAQQIQETYKSVKLAKSYQMLAVAKAQNTRLANQSPAYALSADLTELLSQHLTASNNFEVVQRTIEEGKEGVKEKPETSEVEAAAEPEPEVVSRP